MIQVPNTNLWLGNSSDLRDIPRLLKRGITAIVDLAIEEQLPTIPRATNYCRFVVTDDGENDLANLAAAILCAATFLAGRHSVAICCNAGLNRSPSIGAAVLAYHTHSSPTRSLELISHLKHIDVNPSLWNQIFAVVSTLPQPAT